MDFQRSLTFVPQSQVYDKSLRGKLYFNLESVAYLCMDAIGNEYENSFFRKMLKLRRSAHRRPTKSENGA